MILITAKPGYDEEALRCAIGETFGIAIEAIDDTRSDEEYLAKKFGFFKPLLNEANKMTATPNELKHEADIQAKGLTAPRITPADIDAAIKSVQYHVFEGSCLTVCCITLHNGFTTYGGSACASPENFNKQKGEEVSYEKARSDIWPVLGYALRDKLYRDAVSGNV